MFNSKQNEAQKALASQAIAAANAANQITSTQQIKKEEPDLGNPFLVGCFLHNSRLIVHQNIKNHFILVPETKVVEEKEASKCKFGIVFQVTGAYSVSDLRSLCKTLVLGIKTITWHFKVMVYLLFLLVKIYYY